MNIQVVFICVSMYRARCPNENTSRDGPYLWLSLRASGGMYTVVLGFFESVWASSVGFKVTMREFPMSVILAVRDDVRWMFLAVRSLWTMGGPRLCK